MKKKLIITILIIAAILITAYALFATKTIKLPETIKIPGISTSSVEGTFENNSYVNEWANLKANLPEGWKEASEEEYKTYKNSGADCDFYVLGPNVEKLTVLFLDVSDQKEATEESVLLDLCKGTAGKFENPRASKAKRYRIGDHMYLYSDVTGGVGEYKACVTHNVFMLDNYAVIIVVTGPSAKINHETIKMLDIKENTQE